MEEETVMTPVPAEVTPSPGDEETVGAAEAAAEIIRLQAVIAARENRILELEASLAELDDRAAGLESQRQQAVAAYAQMAVKANPGILPELVAGATVAEVDASLSRARGLVERVRLELEAEAARDSVPAGAPPRTPADPGGLSAAEKIRYAVGRDLH